MEDCILEVYVDKNTRTIRLMDDYEATDKNGKKKYDSLLLKSVFYIKYRRKLYSVGLIVKRKPEKIDYVESSLTFTELKKYLLGAFFKTENRNDYRIVTAIFDAMKSKEVWDSEKYPVRCTFPVPVKFNAQNSSNRTGYGNRYCGEELIYEGTPYGDTTDYMFTGAEIKLF